ncbi:hypothetical protein GCM10025864_39260 [Luteimicrobium album]|uniref:4Fe-4S Wbl-type domain-containing protein n=1 Tax=Luteimicrobium album TaxID=1054550 RepID=A0ABQ6I6U9_9MICO|nr:WhiB family transcriptional regulator [Luteimicrobium album]GMA26167.1 hypothetical protein GCM10025864_39260 [Luteimicrobium album]
MNDGYWRDEAACKDWGAIYAAAGGDPFFPDEARGDERARLVKIAKEICDTCPVWARCATARKRNDVGIWAGQEWTANPLNKHARSIRKEAA